MLRRSGPPFLAILLAAPLHGGGLEVAAGLSILPTAEGGPSHPGGSAATALQLRLGWDQASSGSFLTQGQVQVQAGANVDVRFAMAGAGLQESWWSQNHGFEAALGGELRGERYEGRAGLAPLDGATAWMVRPWLRGQIGFRGILLPLGSPQSELLAWVTQGGRYTHPFTRLEVAVPLWNQGGDGPSGALRHLAPRYEISLQFGLRFGHPETPRPAADREP